MTFLLFMCRHSPDGATGVMLNLLFVTCNSVVGDYRK